MASLENFRLVVFRAVAEQRSFRKAAEELYLTQPAVSLQIKALEEDLGVQLFDRTGSHIALTDAGSTLLGYARQVNALLVQAEHEVAALERRPRRPPRAGRLHHHCAIRAAAPAGRIPPRASPRATHPDQRQHRAHRERGRAAADRARLHRGPAHSRDVKTEPFLVDELVLIVPAAHEWAERDLGGLLLKLPRLHC